MDTYEHLFDEFYLLKLHSEITDKRLQAARDRILELEAQVQKLRREYADFKIQHESELATGLIRSEFHIVRPPIP
jgi:hypothetical protein